MKFYFNHRMNLCASGSWLFEYYFFNEKNNDYYAFVETEKYQLFLSFLYERGWKECQVGNDISEPFDDGSPLRGY